MRTISLKLTEDEAKAIVGDLRLPQGEHLTLESQAVQKIKEAIESDQLGGKPSSEIVLLRKAIQALEEIGSGGEILLEEGFDGPDAVANYLRDQLNL